MKIINEQLPPELLKIKIEDEEGQETIIYNELYNIADEKAVS